MPSTFDSTDYLTVADAAALTFTPPYTIVSYLRPNSEEWGTDYVLSWVSTGDARVQLWIRGSGGSDPGQAQVLLKDAAANQISLTNGSQIWTGAAWHHVALTVTAAGVATFWVDGVAGGTTTNASLGEIDCDATLYVGSVGGTGYYLDASLAEVAVFGKVLIESEIVELKTKPVMKCSAYGDAQWCIPLLSDTTEVVEGLTVTPVGSPSFVAVQHPVSYGGVWPHFMDNSLGNMLSMGM